MVVAAEYRAAPLVLAPHDPPPWHYAELTLTEGYQRLPSGGHYDAWQAMRRAEPGGVK